MTGDVRRRAEPITKHTAKNGTVSYWFQADLGTKADGTRDRRRFTFSTKAEARKELRKITTEVASGTYVKRSKLTVAEACDEWLAGRRGIRAVTLQGYRNSLKPVQRRLGGKLLQQITKADGDDLVEWMLSEGRQSHKHYRPTSLAGRVVELVGRNPEGISAAAIQSNFVSEDVHTCLAGLVRAKRVDRVRRGVYVPAGSGDVTSASTGVKAVTVRSTLKTFGMVVQSFVDQGTLPRNVIALVERPADSIAEADDAAPVVTAKSWTLTEIEQFREVALHERLYACWLLSCYGLRRSEVLGLRWTQIDGDVLSIRQSRVAVGSATQVGLPKSRRSRRDLPLPADVVEALRTLRSRQKVEAMAVGTGWSDDRFIAAHEDGTPVRPEWFSDEFHRLRERAELRRIQLKGLRNTSVSLMLDRGHPVHVVAAWHGHDPSVSLSIYSDAKADELRAVGASLFRPFGD